MVYRSSRFLVCDSGDFGRAVRDVLEGNKMPLQILELAIRNPAQSAAPPWVDLSGQVVSPLQRNDTFMLDSRQAISDQNHR